MFKFWRKQKQKQDNGGFAVQAGNNATVNIHNTGPTIEEVRAIALDVYKANLIEFQSDAKQTASQRGKVINEKFIKKLQQDNPEGMLQARTPDFQDALFTVQKEYAKAGDEELGDLLVDLLVDRTKQTGRSMMQLVLNESLHTAPKLTPEQISTLSIIFLMRHTKATNINSVQDLAAYYQQLIGKITQNIATSKSSFGHLEYSGCGAVSLGSISLEEIFIRTYPGLFKIGFDQNRLAEANLSNWSLTNLLMPCLNDQTKLQIRSIDMESLERNMPSGNVSEQEQSSIKTLFSEGNLGADLVKEKITFDAPFLDEVFQKWSQTDLCRFELTSVGMAIGHANIKKDAGEFAPLSIWIN